VYGLGGGGRNGKKIKGGDAKSGAPFRAEGEKMMGGYQKISYLNREPYGATRPSHSSPSKEGGDRRGRRGAYERLNPEKKVGGGVSKS